MNKVMARIAVILLAAVIAFPGATARAQSFTTLYTFQGMPNSTGPAQALMLDASGNFYGTTYGLLDGARPRQYGTVFRISPTGNVSTLKRFSGPNGSNPEVGHLIQDSEGNLYGVTDFGGLLPGGAEGSGTIYKIDKHWQETVLHTFTYGADGGSPRGTIVRDKFGNLYGTTLGGLTNFGTVYKLKTNGDLRVLHTFRRGTGDGESPAGGLVADADGNLYGATSYGGTVFAGTIFKVSKWGKETVLYSFKGGADGSGPNGELLLDSVGNLYGTTSGAGTSNFGTVFKVDPAGNETVLYSFKGPSPTLTDGAYPSGGLVQDASGNLYGVTWAGGGSNAGTVYKIDGNGNETQLYSFPFATQGSPFGTLVFDAAGNLCGVTESNSTQTVQTFGLVYKITP